MMELANTIEAILFYQAEPMTVKRLSTLLKRSEGEVRDALRVLEERLLPTGLRLLSLTDEVVLGTAPEASAFIEAITKEELSKDLSKASLETLAIVLYKGPITRAEIDYIRGVNSTFILRNLLVRGLVEKVDNPHDQRSFLYRPTFQLLEFMGVANTESLPEYEATMTALAQFVSVKEEADKEDEQKAAAASPVLSSEISEIPETQEPGVIPDLADADEVLPELASDSLENKEVAGTDDGGGTDDDDDDDFDLEEDFADVVDADIAEEDIAGGNFADEALEAHLAADEERAS